MNDLNRARLKAMLKNKASIEINNHLVKKILGFDDMRDFTSELYNWGYQTDFTYDSSTGDWQRHLRAFLKSYFD